MVVIKARIRAAAAEAATDGRVVDRFLEERQGEADADDTRLARRDQAWESPRPEAQVFGARVGNWS
jgi:hypothetical protein